MVFMITLIIVLSIATFIPFSMDAGPIVNAQLNGKALAGEMLVWHAAATRACAVSCPDGPVDPLPYMSASFRDRDDFSKGTIKAYAQGGDVYTSLVLPSNPFSTVVFGETLASLKTTLGTDSATYAGLYSGGEIALAGTDFYTYRDPEDATRTITASFPILPIPVADALGGLAVEGSPMLATLVRGRAVTAPTAPSGGGGCALVGAYGPGCIIE